MHTLLTVLADSTPEDSEVVAGPLGFAIWIFLILAVVLLGRSLVTQLRKAESAKKAGVYGDEPVVADETTDESADQASSQEKADS